MMYTCTLYMINLDIKSVWIDMPRKDVILCIIFIFICVLFVERKKVGLMFWSPIVFSCYISVYYILMIVFTVNNFGIFWIKKNAHLPTSEFGDQNIKPTFFLSTNKTQINIKIIHRMTSFLGISIHTLLMSRFIIYNVHWSPNSEVGRCAFFLIQKIPKLFTVKTIMRI
jgi:hypothetical protein